MIPSDTIDSIQKESLGRPRISVYIAASLDGYIARENGSLDWLERSGSPEEDYGFPALFSSIDALILGRNTYEVVAGFSKWPYSGKRVIVLSNSLESVNSEAELFRGDIMQLVKLLHSGGIQHVWVDGGRTLSQFLKIGMVDQMTVTIIPVILGSGILLFSVGKELPLRLISSQSFPSGLVQVRYEIAE